MHAACYNPRCPEQDLIVEVPDVHERRCRVCAWLMRPLDTDPAEAEVTS